MGHTRAFLTVRLPDGSMVYVNTEKLAAAYLEQIAAASAAASGSPVQNPVAEEVGDRLLAIQPILEDKVLGRNSCSSHRARRNVAEHNFKVRMKDVTLADACHVQRGRPTECSSTDSSVASSSCTPSTHSTRGSPPSTIPLAGAKSDGRSHSSFYIGDGEDLANAIFT